jgi:hypothetical protein
MKTFVARYGFIKAADNDFIGGKETNHHKQGSLFINAKSKKDAIEKMTALGYFQTNASLKIGSGIDMNALLDADVINEDSIILTPDNRPNYVARVWLDDKGVRQVARIGELVRDVDAPVYADKFVPVS